MQIIRQTEGVINFLYWLGKPAVIRDEEIAAMKKFVNDFEFIKLEKTAVNSKQVERITEG